MRKPLLFCIVLCACAPSPAQTTDVSLQPYLTGTPIPTSTPNVLAILETPFPTNTMQVYVIQSGDTISEIAEKFKIPQADLIAANPDVNPNALTIGQTLFIPDHPAQIAAASTLTPVPLPVTQAACHPTANSGLWCFALIHNTTTDPLENVSVQMTLFDESGSVIASQTAFTVLDMIPSNESMPVYTFFPNIFAKGNLQVQFLSAMQGSGLGYLPARLDNTSAQIAWDGKSAQVNGSIYLPAESTAATQVWVAAVAFDEKGTVVGVRRWEGGGIQPGGMINFQFSLSSIGGEIVAVEFFTQAR